MPIRLVWRLLPSVAMALIGKKYFRSSKRHGAVLVTVLDDNTMRVQTVTPGYGATDHTCMYALHAGIRWSMSLVEVHLQEDGTISESDSYCDFDDEDFCADSTICIHFDGAQSPVGWEQVQPKTLPPQTALSSALQPVFTSA